MKPVWEKNAESVLRLMRGVKEQPKATHRAREERLGRSSSREGHAAGWLVWEKTCEASTGGGFGMGGEGFLIILF